MLCKGSIQLKISISNTQFRNLGPDIISNMQLLWGETNNDPSYFMSPAINIMRKSGPSVLSTMQDCAWNTRADATEFGVTREEEQEDLQHAND